MGRPEIQQEEHKMGDITTKLEVNKTKGRRIKVHCSQCMRETNHNVLQSVDTEASETLGFFDGFPMCIDWSDHFQIIQCQGCDAISFRHVHWFSEDRYPIGPDEWHDGTTVRLYPRRSESTRPIKAFVGTPGVLRRIYQEMIEYFNNDALTLCAAGLRAIIEGVCADQQIASGPVVVWKDDGTKQTVRKSNLEGKISGLAEKGILTQQHSAILHQHRFLGNDAVHELSRPSPEELALAIEIIEHILDALYEVPSKAGELQRFRAKRLKEQKD